MSPETVDNCKAKYELKIPSHPRNLAKARLFIGKIARSCKFSNAEVFDIQVAVGEALANAIEHGSPLGTKNTVTINCCCNGEYLEIIITDQGRFDNMLPNSTSADLDFRGRGILLMLSLMDKVSIDELKEGTAVSLTKKHHL